MEQSKRNTAEHKRLKAHRDRKANWKQWGPYLAERAWATVREDYSKDGNAWDYFPFEHANARSFRWGEDGIGGFSDRFQYLCFSLGLWNGQDEIIKERLFGLTNPEGNHGEDVKEYYFYLDSTPTHSYMKMLYKYPHQKFPYSKLREESKKRSPKEKEYELADTGIFKDNKYFDVQIEYAKAGETDILVKISATNRGAEKAKLWLLPQLWFRNTWAWGYPKSPMKDLKEKPSLRARPELGRRAPDNFQCIETEHPVLGKYYFYAQNTKKLIFTENETNNSLLFNKPNSTHFTKDAFNSYLVNNADKAVNREDKGTKSVALYQKELGPGEEWVIKLCLLSSRAQSRDLTQSKFSRGGISPLPLVGRNDKLKNPFKNFDKIFLKRQQEADEFYSAIQNPKLYAEEKNIQRQAYAGLLWSKQFYYFDHDQWRQGDPEGNNERRPIRNSGWEHMKNFDIISMPDKWEFPWYATWDLAFHCLPMAELDPDFAKRQLILLTREWYMHPSGQLPAYEWEFSSVNPPVHAWAAWRIYKQDAANTGVSDTKFLEAIFHKLLLNFTWWVNRKDIEGKNIFQGGFLGLDNIGVFDRTADLPPGGHLDQADSTSWMAAYSLTMLKISLELSRSNSVYQDVATKFFEHFLRIASAISHLGGDEELNLWDEHDGFYYDILHLEDGSSIPLKVRSMVGLLPLIAVQSLEPEIFKKFPDFDRRMHWFIENVPHLAGNIASCDVPGFHKKRLFAIATRERLTRVLEKMLDETEFLSDFGLRSVSKFHASKPFCFDCEGHNYSIGYEPGESESRLFGGNSNWRGPVWFPLNYMIIESLREFHQYYGDDFKIKNPSKNGKKMNLSEVADELSGRLIKIFMPDKDGQRPVFGDNKPFAQDPHWRKLLLFHEYFHGDTARGLGASHQTGWTALVATLLQQKS